MPRPRRNPIDPGTHATRRRRIRETFTNPFCPHRDHCLDRHIDEEVLDCRGCPHEHDQISSADLALDIEPAMRLLWTLFVDDGAAWIPIQIIMGAVLGDRYGGDPYHCMGHNEIECIFS